MSVPYLGDFSEDQSVFVVFNTFDSNDPSASVTITNLADTDIHIHKDDGTTQHSSATDVDVQINFDAITGNHMVEIRTTNVFFSTGADYFVRMEGTTVDAATINAWIAHFSIENRHSAGALRPTVAGRTLDVTATGAAGVDWANVEGQATAVDLSGTDIQLTDTATTVTNGVSLAAGSVTNASLAGNMEIVFETDFATNYNTTRNAWVTNYTDTIGTALVTLDAVAHGGAGASLTLDTLTVDNSGGSGDAVRVLAGTNGDAVDLVGNGTGNGLRLIGGGTSGGNEGYGLYVHSDTASTVLHSTNTHAFALSPGGSGSGIDITASSGGYGIAARGAIAGLFATGDLVAGAFIQTNGTNKPAVRLNGIGSGAGLQIFPGVTGNGVQITGGATSGDAINLSVTSGDEIDYGGTELMAAINAECDTALETYGLQYLINTPLPTNWATDITANSALDYVADDGTAVYDRTTDSLQAISDSGGGGPTAAQIVDEWESQSQADPTGFHVNVMEVGGTAQTPNDNGADINAILTDTNELQIDDVPALIAALNNLSAADVNTQVKDVIATDTISELTQGVPDAQPTLEKAIMLLYMALRNKLDVSTVGTDTLEIHNDAGTRIAQKLITDDGSDYSEAKMTTGA